MKNSFLALTLAGASVGFVALAAACSSSDSTSSSSSSSSSSSGSSGADAAKADTSTGGDAAPAATPTFTEIYTGIITAKCAPCHTTAGGSGVSGGKLDMTSQAAAYTNLVGAKAAGESCGTDGRSRVTAGDPDNSIMYLKVSDDDPAPCGAKMPLGSAGLDAESSDAIKAWITAGAKND